MRKTKIVCTLGPSTADISTIKNLIKSGMNVARLNFSHGDHSSHRIMIDLVRKAAEYLKTNIAIMLDTKGPEIRIKTFQDNSCILHEGDTFIFSCSEVSGNNNRVSVTLPDLYLYLSDGDIILVDDGLLKFKVIDINGKDIICQILTGGIISNNKSINIPNVDIELPSLTDKDKEDLLFGIENNVDFIAASFIRNKNDVNEIRKFLDLNGGYNIQIISKIENQSGVDNIEEILDVSYGIMVARGDLGVEIPAEDVPLVQKMIIKKCNEVGKPVITATQMLDSMIRNPSPTRAETTDVSNAVLDGTDAVMLSGETASGKYPIESVDTMRRIILKTESTYNKNVNSFYGDNTVTNIVSFASCYAANKLHCAAIITPTASGYTPRMISKYRPTAPIIAISNDDNVINHLSLTRGVFCIKLPNWDDFEQIVNESILAATEFGFINDGDLVVITNGLPSSSAAKTNTMRIETAGNHISRGKSLFSKGRIKGRYKIFDECTSINQKCILATNIINDEIINNKDLVLAIVSSANDISDACINFCYENNIPILGNVKDIHSIPNNTLIELDLDRNLLYKIEH